ncbi:hypothetical protein M422DRAFT_257546 [Sphaerobolus stellatus SS14]|uniref:Uncharacterized protein n=1 Tax=Sphaerobolus stellatus (strain SS14) TaxID=990650 RepID=A0A0C9VNQ4_SPHS4|nr:hypothetical protein M422DRAFT_257546 [Sphaerobolus stellatus SS14]
MSTFGRSQIAARKPPAAATRRRAQTSTRPDSPLPGIDILALPLTSLPEGTPMELSIQTEDKYNRLHSSLILLLDWRFTFKLDTDVVSEGFYLYSLLLDHERNRTLLRLSHRGAKNAERLKEAWEARNARMAGTRQQEWNHVREGCTKLFKEENGTIGVFCYTILIVIIVLILGQV